MPHKDKLHSIYFTTLQPQATREPLPAVQLPKLPCFTWTHFMQER